MKFGFGFAAALGLLAVSATTATESRADDPDISTQFVVAATQSGGKVNIVITPANDHVYINSEFALKIHVDPKSGGKVDKTDLTKDDGTYVASGKDGKALKVTFTVNADKGVTGNGKLVVCSATGCGNPSKFTFTST